MAKKTKAKKTKPAASPVRREYHFSLGNSSEGPVGFCAVVVACSPEEALAKLQAALPIEQPVHPWDEDVVYINAYFNPEAVTLADIDEVADLPSEIDGVRPT